MSHAFLVLSTVLFTSSCLSNEDSDWNKIGRPLLAVFVGIGAMAMFMFERTH